MYGIQIRENKSRRKFLFIGTQENLAGPKNFTVYSTLVRMFWKKAPCFLEKRSSLGEIYPVNWLN